MRFRIGVDLNYSKERWNKVDGLLLRLDDESRTWEEIAFLTPKKFDFEAIEKICEEKEYEIVGLKLRDPKSVSFSTNAFSDSAHIVHVREFEDFSTVSIENETSQFLAAHFYALINPKKVFEILGSSILMK